MDTEGTKQEMPPSTPPLPPLPLPQTPSQASSAGQDYDMVADKIGLIPNIRKQDNLLQAKIIAITTVLGILIGLIVDLSTVGALLGALAGLILGTFVSGFVLMIIGLKRKR